MNTYYFTNDWFENSNMKQFIKNFFNGLDEIHILEIGCFEGRSSCYFSDELLHNDLSSLTCVDPFNINDKTTHVNLSTESIFYHNISKSKNFNKIQVHCKYSDNFFMDSDKIKIYDLAYIDGCHIPDQIVRDLENVCPRMKENGIVWLDDYEGGENSEKLIKNAIDNFISKHNSKIKIIVKGYQIAFRIINWE
jgi:predicted O-methyltransferase YrrM